MNGTSTKPASTKINNLQALRAFAAVAVVFYHTGLTFPHCHLIGDFGVDIFFVLSGYIMARICEKDSQLFMRRRLIRILPPYWFLTLLLFLIAMRAPHLLGSTNASVPDLVKSLCFIPFMKGSGAIRPVLFVGWTLNYEMFFYTLIWLSLRILPRNPMLVAGGVVAAAHCAALLSTHPNVYLLWLREPFILEFPLGAIVYFLTSRVPAARAVRWRGGSLALFTAAILASLALQATRPALGHQLNGSVAALLGTLIVLFASLLSRGGWDTRLASVVLLGDASYILYLVHPYVESVVQRLLAPRVPLLELTRPLGCVVAVVTACAVGVLLHLHAERPVLAFLNERFGGHRKSVEFAVPPVSSARAA